MDCLTGVLVCDISIHAPRTGSDAFPCLAARAYSNFNPRSPHGERRRQRPKKKIKKSYFNPRSPHGERRGILSSPTDERRISIHAPRTGSDLIFSEQTVMDALFQSTLPARGATRVANATVDDRHISIHAPRTGSDGIERRSEGEEGDFNPRSPHGERPRPFCRCSQIKRFQSTLPARGATKRRRKSVPAKSFQSTLPARGATSNRGNDAAGGRNFNPRSPHGERRSRPSALAGR